MQNMIYRRCGRSGLLLPAMSLGLWQNFGDRDDYKRSEGIILEAFDRGITYFDLANNYGPSAGSAEINFGRILSENLRLDRDQLVIATKAGYTMWPGPYGDWGSRKSLIASCDQSLRRMKLDYVDIFYSHRYDPETPLEETMGALDHIVRSGRALYVGVSNYPADKFREAVAILSRLGTPCLVDQVRYSMLVQERGDSLFDAHRETGVGCVTYSPLAQGVLTDRYLNGIPDDSRAAKQGTLSSQTIRENLPRIQALNDVARQRGQTLAEMAIAWQLRDERVTSVIVGVSSVQQLGDNLAALNNTVFAEAEIAQIDSILRS